MRAFDELIGGGSWQMTPGERVALDGVLAAVKPRLAIEIGTAQGGSLERIAAHSGEVHSFDLVEPDLPADRLGNVALHVGDSHVLLPETLAELAAADRNVDFVLVDGDHTADGVRRDMLDLVASPAVRRTVILVHDTLNDSVREGLEAFASSAEAHGVAFEWDFIGGHLSHGPVYHHQLWGGLGLAIVDPDGPARALHYPWFYPTFELLAAVRDAAAAAEAAGAHVAPGALGTLRAAMTRGAVDVHDRAGAERAALAARCAELERELATARRVLAEVKGSASWRVTRPLRAVKGAAGRVRGGA